MVYGVASCCQSHCQTCHLAAIGQGRILQNNIDRRKICRSVDTIWVRFPGNGRLATEITIVSLKANSIQANAQRNERHEHIEDASSEIRVLRVNE